MFNFHHLALAAIYAATAVLLLIGRSSRACVLATAAAAIYAAQGGDPRGH